MAPKPSSVAASEIVRAVDRLAAVRDPRTGKPIGREKAAARLLPHMKPDAAARYVRKLRSGERSGAKLISRPTISRRVQIFVREQPAMIVVEFVDEGEMIQRVSTGASGSKVASIPTILPGGVATADQFKQLPEFDRWIERAEAYLRRRFHYRPIIADILGVKRMRVLGGREIVPLVPIGS